MDPYKLINKYYKNYPRARKILIEHSQAVARHALEIASKLELSKKKLQFIEEAALLHDIGIFLTDAPSIGCRGTYPYICHGYLGHDIMVREGYPKHAKVCERHTGTGIKKSEIIKRNLPIPIRSMVPKSITEEIIAYADKFYSKDPDKIGSVKSVEKIKQKLARHGDEKVAKFISWHQQFNI